MPSTHHLIPAPVIADWVAERIPHVGDSGGFGARVAIGVVSRRSPDDSGRLLAGVVYHDYHPATRTMQVSIAADSPMWARPSTIAALLSYPFDQAGVYRLWTAVPSDCPAVLKVNAHIGFRREAVLAHHFGRGRHAVVARMLAPQYRRTYKRA